MEFEADGAKSVMDSPAHKVVSIPSENGSGGKSNSTRIVSRASPQKFERRMEYVPPDDTVNCVSVDPFCHSVLVPFKALDCKINIEPSQSKVSGPRYIEGEIAERSTSIVSVSVPQLLATMREILPDE